MPKPNRGGSSSASPSRGGSVDADRRARRSSPSNDHWQWFGRVIAERKIREGDPVVAVLEQKAKEAAAAAEADPDDAELAALQ